MGTEPHQAIPGQSDGASVDFADADSLLLLYTKGRKSGKIRRTLCVNPLIPVSTRDGDDILVLASKDGAPVHPDWYFNLVEDSTVWVRDKGDFYEATATTLDPQERAAAWENVVAVFPFVEELATKTDRVIPIVRLAPKG